MAETTADVRRDIELTRERMSDTLAQLERKLNVLEVVREHPWLSLALATGAGILLAGSKADVKAAAAAAAATGGAGSKVGALVDDVASRLIGGVSSALGERVDRWVDDLKAAITTPAASRERPGARSALADRSTSELGSPRADTGSPGPADRPPARAGSVGPLAH
jgi:hypothetical protein